jgi:hypothetical protein
MTIPALQGTIARRILVNFRADPDVVQRHLPPPFRPKLQAGHAIVGICLIRLEDIRPAVVTASLGFSSENAAHRIAVLWEDAGGATQEGVYIPRRDTGSRLNHWSGGRLFPGEHHLAHFEVQDEQSSIHLTMRSADGEVEVRVAGEVAETLPPDSCFPDLTSSSQFFEGGCLGFSARQDGGLDGLRLVTKSWEVRALHVIEVYSSLFSDRWIYSEGSIAFDHALLMRNIPHEWHSAPAPRSGSAESPY